MQLVAELEMPRLVIRAAQPVQP